MVHHSPGYLADHGGSKGHILLCLEGELVERQQERRQLQFDLQRANADIAMAQERLQNAVVDRGGGF